MPQQVKDARRKFTKDFPWLGMSLDFMFGDCSPDAPEENRRIAGRWNFNRYEVDVQRADATLLFRMLKRNQIQDPIRGRYAEQEDYLAYIVGNQLCRGVLGHYRPREIFNRNSFHEVEYLVWVTIQAWYEHKQPATFGVNFLEREPAPADWSFMERVMKVTIYKPPRESWAELYRTTTLSDTVLTEADLRRGASRDNPDCVAIQLKLGALAGQFADGLYASGLRDQILAAYEQGNTGMSTSGAAITLRSYVVSGCIFINMSSRTSQVTFCGFVDEDEHQKEGLRWQGMNSWPGIHGSIPQVEELISVAESAWPMPSFKPRNIHGPF